MRAESKNTEFLSPLDKLTREFAANNWAACADGLLQRTDRIRVWPEPSPAPLSFEFEIDTPYKRKLTPRAPVELVAGPVRGRILYRRDMFENPDGPLIAVQIDRRLGYFHPNYDRDRGFLCLGDQRNLPPGPQALDLLLENHIFPIVSYQNRSPIHPLDFEAARYFAFQPTAMDGLEPVVPLY
jgi:hypothetical protein